MMLFNTLYYRKHLMTAFFVFLFSCLSTQAIAQEVLLGKVVAIDREGGSFSLEIDGTKEDELQIVIIQNSGIEEREFFPNCIQVGESVRVWGQYDSKNIMNFQADVVRGPGRNHYDKSGVRTRLNRGRGKSLGRSSGRSRQRN